MNRNASDCRRNRSRRTSVFPSFDAALEATRPRRRQGGNPAIDAAAAGRESRRPHCRNRSGPMPEPAPLKAFWQPG